MEIMHFRIWQFTDEQSNFVGGSALKIDQGQVVESVKLQKQKRKLKNYLKFV